MHTLVSMHHVIMFCGKAVASTKGNADLLLEVMQTQDSPTYKCAHRIDWAVEYDRPDFARLDASGTAKPLTEIRGYVPNGSKCIGPRNALSYVYREV